MNMRYTTGGTDPHHLSEYAVRRLHAGAGSLLPVPAALSHPYGQPEAEALYRSSQGYAFAWGDVLEETNGGAERVTYHFVPHKCAVDGHSGRGIKEFFEDWSAGLAQVFTGYVAPTRGPAFVALSLRSEHVLAREWLAEVFLPMYWGHAIERWMATEDTAPANDVVPAEPFPNTDVLVICPHASSDRSARRRPRNIHLVLITKEAPPRMCYATLTPGENLSMSAWLQLPSSHRLSDAAPIDFVLDFYKGLGAEIGECVGAPSLDLAERLAGFENARASAGVAETSQTAV